MSEFTDALEIKKFRELVKQVEEVYLNAACEDEDLWGGGVLDLMADQFANLPLLLLKQVIVASSIISIANYRINRQIVKYAQELDVEIIR